MGKTKFVEYKPFTIDHIKNKQLIMDMLKYEDTLIHGDTGHQIFTDPSYKNQYSLFSTYTIHRMVLQKFGFNTSHLDVANYRSIFSNYYRSPTDYDPEVLNSVTYMRENKCVYYNQPIINIGDKLPNCEIYEIDGKTKTTLYDKIGTGFNYMLIGGFSHS